MSEPQRPEDLRRSSRITISITIEVTGRNAEGMEITETATTKYVNKQGALLLLKYPFPLGAEVEVSIPRLERQQKCKVVWVSKERNERGQFGIGVELDRAENFWGVQFPPDDWVPARQAPLAGDSSVPLPSPSKGDDNERDMVRTMLNALVSVLEEKGLVTRAELAEMFQRLNREEPAPRDRRERRTD